MPSQRFSRFDNVYPFHPFVFFCQLMEGFHTGLPGLSVASHVVMELNSVIDYAPILLLETVEKNAKDPLWKHVYVSLKCARHQVTIKRFSLMTDRCYSGT